MGLGPEDERDVTRRSRTVGIADGRELHTFAVENKKFRGTGGTTGLFEKCEAGTGEQNEFKRRDREDLEGKREEDGTVRFCLYIIRAC